MQNNLKRETQPIAYIREGKIIFIVDEFSDWRVRHDYGRRSYYEIICRV